MKYFFLYRIDTYYTYHFLSWSLKNYFLNVFLVLNFIYNFLFFILNNILNNYIFIINPYYFYEK